MDPGGAEVLLGHVGDGDHVILLGALGEEIADEGADGEVLPQVLLPLLHGGKACDLPLGILASEALFRLGHQDQGAAVGHHLQGVGEGLDGLVEVQVLGIAAGAGDDQRGLLLHRHAVHPVHQITGRPVGGDPVAGKGGNDLLLVIHHHVQQKGGVHHGAGLHHVSVDRVGGVHVGTADVGVGTAADTGIQGQVVVFHNGLTAGDARQDALAAAAEARHEVVHHAAGEDDLVTGQGPLVQPDRGAPTGGAHIGQDVLVRADVVLHPDPVVHRLGHQADVLFLCLAAVGSGGGENEDVLIPDAGGLQLRDQDGEIGVRRLPAAGHVGDDDADLVAGLHQFLQRGGVDGMVQGPADVLRRGPLRQIHLVGLQLRGDQLRGQMNFKFLPAVFHGFCHGGHSLSWHRALSGPLLMSSSLYADPAEMSTANVTKFARQMSSSSTTGQWSLPSTSLQMSAFLILSFSRSETIK